VKKNRNEDFYNVQQENGTESESKKQKIQMGTEGERLSLIFFFSTLRVYVRKNMRAKGEPHRIGRLWKQICSRRLRNRDIREGEERPNQRREERSDLKAI